MQTPKVPFSLCGKLKVDGSDILVRPAFKGVRLPLEGLRIDMVDSRSSRVTVTRAVAVGIFALAARKRVGSVALIFTAADGAQATVKFEKNEAGKAIEWAAQFNALSEVAA